MAEFVTKNPPEFSTEMRMLEPTDPGHANVFNPLIAQLLNNDNFLKAIVDLAKEHMEDAEIHVTEKDKEYWDAKAGTGTATQSEPGLMSAGDKKKLDNVAEGAEVNQNAYSNIKVGSVTITANRKTSTLTLEAGTNITISADNAAKKITIAADKNGGNANTLGGHQASHFASADHAHDGRYYTETEVNSLLAGKAASSHSHAYLPLSGGTMTGVLNANKGAFIPFATALYFGKCIVAGTDLYGNGSALMLYPEGWSTLDDCKSVLQIGSMGGEDYYITCTTSNKYYLGCGGFPYKALYATTGTIQTSDRKKKKDIKEFDDKFVEAFIMGLTPVSYMLKENESGRTHYGLIAQDVEDLMDKLEMDSKDFAGFIKSPRYKENIEEIEVENEVIGEDGEKKTVKEKRQNIKRELLKNEYEYALRYEEFIAPIIKMLQILNNKLNSQQEEIGKLQTEIEELKVK